MSVYPPKTHGPILYDILAMKYHFIQRGGSNTTNRFMLVETREFNAPTSDGPLGSNAKSIFLL